MRKQLYSAVAAVSLVAAWGPGACAKDPPAGLDLVRQLNRAFEDVAERVSPAVVVINVVQKTTSPSSEGEEDDSFQGLPPGFWRKFHEQFKRQMPDESRAEGSGIIVRDNGYILTNGHVIQDAESIQVRLQDGRVFKGVLRGIDSQSDVAVIKIEAGGLPVAKLGDSNKTRVGEFAIAIGAPFSLDYSVTFGHISAKSRSVIEGYEGAGMDQDFLQTDALINPGNSGGPLLNIEGQVIGINTLIRGLHTGIAFAIPSNLAREVADQIIAYGRFSRPWLGIYIQSLRENADLRQQFRDINDGVVISRILPKGPAGKSNLKPTDVILAIDGQHVSTAEQLRAAIREKKIGRPVRLDVFRDGKTIEVSVSPGEYVDPTPVAVETKAPTKGPAGAMADLGITVKPLTPELASQFGVDTARGVVIAAVERDSPAGRKGLKPGEIITSINRRQISSPKEFREALKTLDLDKGVLVDLLSSEAARFEILKRTEP